MEHTDKEYCLEVWGERACFTRPELKVERVSYDIITPSAARAIFEAILFKRYAMRWQVTRIDVLAPIRWTAVRRNEVGAVATALGKPIYIEDKRQQRNTMMLRDVRYRLWAKLVYIPVNDRPREAFARHAPGSDENPQKYYQMFERRASAGQCFTQPYLGTRECAADFRLVDTASETLAPTIAEDRDLGIMLYDMDFADLKNIQPMFYRPQMRQGTIIVPPKESEEVLK